jgi:RNA polymerase sigma factor (sigma-70 family)
MSPATFETLYNSHAGELTFFATKILKDQQAAEDVVSTVFIKVWESGIECHRNALYIFVKNACIDELRKNKKREKGEALFMPTEIEIEHASMWTDYIKRIYELVKDLPEKQREIFIRTYIDGKDARVISGEMGITVSTVTTQRQRGVEYVRGKIIKSSLNK